MCMYILFLYLTNIVYHIKILFYILFQSFSKCVEVLSTIRAKLELTSNKKNYLIFLLLWISKKILTGKNKPFVPSQTNITNNTKQIDLMFANVHEKSSLREIFYTQSSAQFGVCTSGAADVGILVNGGVCPCRLYRGSKRYCALSAALYFSIRTSHFRYFFSRSPCLLIAT